MSALELLNFDNEVFKCYVFWSAVLVVKMLVMGPLTGMQRFKHKAFANPEDVLRKNDKIRFDDPDVERIRRAHRNDMENILPFFAIGLLYVLTNPSVFLATYLFRVFALARIVHTFVYAVVVVRQPARGCAYFIAVSVLAYMTCRVIIFTI